ncbi:MAG TPA: hypothetical protein VGP31_02250 [Planosporangium sp.]|nr:hypothetical protein [Planosporangium sp.]
MERRRLPLDLLGAPARLVRASFWLACALVMTLGTAVDGNFPLLLRRAPLSLRGR